MRDAVCVGVGDFVMVAVGVSVKTTPPTASATLSGSEIRGMEKLTGPLESDNRTDLLVSQARICGTDAEESMPLRIAHAPATCGAAIEVPDFQ